MKTKKGQAMSEKSVMGMTFQMNEEFINNLAKQMVTESIMETIGGGEKFVSQIVAEILNTKVDPSNGRVSTYSSAVPYIKYLMDKVIRDEITGTIQDVLNEKRPEIRACIRRSLMEDNTVEKLYNGFVESVIDNMRNPYRTRIDISFEGDK